MKQSGNDWWKGDVSSSRKTTVILRRQCCKADCSRYVAEQSKGPAADSWQLAPQRGYYQQSGVLTNQAHQQHLQIVLGTVEVM